jgi:signal transduction histidine kinase
MIQPGSERLRRWVVAGIVALLGIVLSFSAPGDAPRQQTTTSWTATVNLAGQLVGLQIEVNEESVTIGSASLWLFGLGLAISLLTGWLILDRSRRRAMIQQLLNLEQALAEKDRFLASVSHESRTPLTAVVGALELLGRNTTLGPEIRDMLLKDARVSASNSRDWWRTT